MSALVSVLIRRGVFTEREWAEAWLDEALKLDKDYERRFPGITTDQDGVTYTLPTAADTMRNWKP